MEVSSDVVLDNKSMCHMSDILDSLLVTVTDGLITEVTVIHNGQWVVKDDLVTEVKCLSFSYVNISLTVIL